ncbi:MAG TPA: helix-turn-helix transcriptional regulator [Kofleriaceae bacterium]|jgi:AraC-like DNA-binding protein
MDIPQTLRDDDGGPLVFTRAGTLATAHDTEPHSHARGQLIACGQGVIVVGTQAGNWIIPARHAVWLPPHAPHSGRTQGDVAGWSLYIAKPACAALPAQPCTLAISPLLWEAALRSAEWGVSPSDADARLAQVIVDEIRKLEIQPLCLAMPRDERAVRVARAILDNPAEARGLAGWARFASMSSRTLTRHFVTETSLTLTEWIQRARLIRSLELLAADVPVTTIAIELGYRSVSAFIAVFKRAFGTTPAKYS